MNTTERGWYLIDGKYAWELKESGWYYHGMLREKPLRATFTRLVPAEEDSPGG